MTSVQVKSAQLGSTDSQIVSIESSFMRGFSGLSLIGSSSDVCRGGLLRAEASLEACEIKIPQRKIIVSLFPAGHKKEGNQFDLAFAVCLFYLTQAKEAGENLRTDLDQWLFASELSLDGKLNGVKGAINFALAAMEEKLQGIVVSEENFAELKELTKVEGLACDDFQILKFKDLAEVLLWIRQKDNGKSFEKIELIPTVQQEYKKVDQPNFDDMCLNPLLTEVAASIGCGRHNLFISGAPGTGKSMFSHRIASVLPKITQYEKLEVLKIHSSFSGKIERHILEGAPPFRSPHHSSSASAILGSEYSPGEISLAHNGLLFLDEFPEFRKDVIESLREPLETGNITVSRSKTKVSWKSKFILVIAANNCPCGWLGSSIRRCACPSSKIIHYKRRLSGPILDRIDIHINIDERQTKSSYLLDSLDRRKNSQPQTSRNLYEIIAQGREFSAMRNKKWGINSNAELKTEHLIEATELSTHEFKLLLSQFNLDKLSNRSVLKVLRVARTLSDLDLCSKVREQDLLKALSWTSDSCAKSRGDLAYGFV